MPIRRGLDTKYRRAFLQIAVILLIMMNFRFSRWHESEVAMHRD